MEMVFTLTGNVEIVVLFGQSRTYQVIARSFKGRGSKQNICMIGCFFYNLDLQSDVPPRY